jgi:sugar/nucleoside kinase (ribokinase family)
MEEPRYDVIAIGNAIVDVIGPAATKLIDELQLNRGGMTLGRRGAAQELYDAMGPARETSGGSAANTLAGSPALGAQCAFIGQVASDQFGRVFAHDIHSVGIDFDVPAREGEPPTAQCLIFVTPDGQRTMNTFLGARSSCPPADRRGRRSAAPASSTSKATCGIPRSRARRCAGRSRPRAPPGARSPSRSARCS